MAFTVWTQPRSRKGRQTILLFSPLLPHTKAAHLTGQWLIRNKKKIGNLMTSKECKKFTEINFGQVSNSPKYSVKD